MHVDARRLGLARSSPARWHRPPVRRDVYWKVVASDGVNAVVSSARADQANVFVENHADCRPLNGVPVLAGSRWNQIERRPAVCGDLCTFSRGTPLGMMRVNNDVKNDTKRGATG